MASASRNSALRPPRPCPRTVTVVSPPEISTQGAWAGWPKLAHWRAIAACTSATSRDSPSMLLARIIGAMPASNAIAAAASSEACGVAIMMFSTRARRGSPGFGVSSSLARKRCNTGAGASMPYLARMARASALLDGSATVGPEAITDGSSPGTSEIISATTLAGAAASASRPPLMAERCLRTAFISPMVAPLFSSALLTACLSASVKPGAGRLRSAEPPPEIRQRTRSSGVSPRTSSKMRSAASRPAASGTGWPASITSILLVGSLWP